MKWFTLTNTGGVMLGVIRLKMVKKLLSGDTARIVANGIGVCFSADIPPQQLINGTNV